MKCRCVLHFRVNSNLHSNPALALFLTPFPSHSSGFQLHYSSPHVLPVPSICSFITGHIYSPFLFPSPCPFPCCFSTVHPSRPHLFLLHSYFTPSSSSLFVSLSLLLSPSPLSAGCPVPSLSGSSRPPDGLVLIRLSPHLLSLSLVLSLSSCPTHMHTHTLGWQDKRLCMPQGNPAKQDTSGSQLLVYVSWTSFSVFTKEKK